MTPTDTFTAIDHDTLDAVSGGTHPADGGGDGISGGPGGVFARAVKRWLDEQRNPTRPGRATTKPTAI